MQSELQRLQGRAASWLLQAAGHAREHIKASFLQMQSKLLQRQEVIEQAQHI